MQAVRVSMMPIYADHAATTPLLPEVLDAMMPFLSENFGNPSSSHQWAKPARKALAEARETIAECINAEPDEIVFTSGGTEADNWAVKRSSGGLLVSAYEHHAVLNSAAAEATGGRRVAYARPTSCGAIGCKSLAEAWFLGTGLVSVMTANNEIGTVNPIRELAEFAHEHGALFHTDAVQAVGHIPIDVRELGVDMLSASGHKFNGPKGTGFLFLKRGTRLSPYVDGGSQESGLRAGTENVASIVGMAAALKKNCEKMRETTVLLEGLTSRLRDGISAICPEAVFHGHDGTPRLPGFLSVAFPGHSAEGMLHMLDLKGIAVSAGAACNSKDTEISHVLRALGVQEPIAESTIRISLGFENTPEEVDEILAALKSILRIGEMAVSRNPTHEV